MARRPKLTQEMVDEAIRPEADGLSNGDIICALGIHESTFYRWIGDPKNKLQRALSEGLKKRRARSSGRCSPRSARRRSRATSTGQRRRGCWSASTPTSPARRSARATRGARTRRPGSCSASWRSRCRRSSPASTRAVPMVDASALVIPRFHDVLGDVMAHGHTHYWLYGGRGSTKSSFISVCIEPRAGPLGRRLLLRHRCLPSLAGRPLRPSEGRLSSRPIDTCFAESWRCFDKVGNQRRLGYERCKTNLHLGGCAMRAVCV